MGKLSKVFRILRVVNVTDRSDIHENIFWINNFNFDINEHEVISFHSYNVYYAQNNV